MRKMEEIQHGDTSERAVPADQDKEDVDDLDEADESIPYTYSITSYGADYPVDSLIKRLKSKDIIVPTFDWVSEEEPDVVGFQREYVLAEAEG